MPLPIIALALKHLAAKHTVNHVAGHTVKHAATKHTAKKHDDSGKEILEDLAEDLLKSKNETHEEED